MDLKITKDIVEFNNSKLGSSKYCVFVEFPNCISTVTNRPFRWMPTYKQLKDISKALGEIELESWHPEEPVCYAEEVIDNKHEESNNGRFSGADNL